MGSSEKLGGLHLQLRETGGRILETNLEIDLENRVFEGKMDKLL